MSVFPTLPAHPSLLPPDEESSTRPEPRVQLVLIRGEGSGTGSASDASAPQRSIRSA
jgi:hypothetical protein